MYIPKDDQRIGFIQKFRIRFPINNPAKQAIMRHVDSS
jgi:hypothetical protein